MENQPNIDEQPTNTNLPSQPEGVLQSVQKVPRALVEILVEGHEKNKAEIKRAMDILQAQIIKTKNSERVRIFYHLTSKGNEPEDKAKRIEFLLKECACKYYILLDLEANGFSIKTDFIKDVMNAIKKTESGIETMKNLGIKIDPKKPK